jgi:hypothetical protein
MLMKRMEEAATLQGGRGTWEHVGGGYTKNCLIMAVFFGPLQTTAWGEIGSVVINKGSRHAHQESINYGSLA